MKKINLFLLFFLLFSFNSHGFKQEDLDKLKAINQCIGCNLTEAPLFGLDLNGANLQDAKLDFANLENVSLRDANLGLVSMRGTYLIGANLVRTNLTDGDLSGANLQNANLTGSVMLVIDQLQLF